MKDEKVIDTTAVKVPASQGLIAHRLAELGLELPSPNTPSANYVSARRSGQLVFISGQVPRRDGRNFHVGRVGEEVSFDEACEAARLCTLNMLSQLSAELGGNLDRVMGCIRIGGFVNASETFERHPEVINAASDLLVDVFGEKGRHARAAIGAGSLPRRFSVEIEGIFEID